MTSVISCAGGKSASKPVPAGYAVDATDDDNVPAPAAAEEHISTLTPLASDTLPATRRSRSANTSTAAAIRQRSWRTAHRRVRRDPLRGSTRTAGSITTAPSADWGRSAANDLERCPRIVTTKARADESASCSWPPTARILRCATARRHREPLHNPALSSQAPRPSSFFWLGSTSHRVARAAKRRRLPAIVSSSRPV